MKRMEWQSSAPAPAFGLRFPGAKDYHNSQAYLWTRRNAELEEQKAFFKRIVGSIPRRKERKNKKKVKKEMKCPFSLFLGMG